MLLVPKCRVNCIEGMVWSINDDDDDDGDDDGDDWKEEEEGWLCRYDDQQDYFDLNDTWNGRTASGDAYKPVYIERSKVGTE